MEKLFEADIKNGSLEVFREGSHTILVSAFSKSARGVPIDLNGQETADLTEALLRSLDRHTRLSVIESVLGIKETQDVLERSTE